MSLDLLKTKGRPLAKQGFTWKDLVRKPISKLDCDAFTRVRVILMNGIEEEAMRFSHSCARMNQDLQKDLAMLRRVEQHQHTMINWLIPADHSPLETTIAYEQVAIEVTAALAQVEPDPYIAQSFRFGLLEDFDHMYRYSALLDRLEGKDSNNILQSYTDVHPGRPTIIQHRHPHDDLRTPYDKNNASPITKLNALTLVSGEQQTHNYYMNIGPLFTDPVARLLYAEIASIEEQHVTHYESLIDPEETWMEKWLMHEANEVYNYYSCVQTEDDPRLKEIWERFLDYELGHLNHVMELFKKYENRDPAEILPETLPTPISYKSQRQFVMDTLRAEVDLRTDGPNYVEKSQESEKSKRYRDTLNSEGSPTEIITQGYIWQPGGELNNQQVRNSIYPQ
ncbi:hypothetical protein AZI87_04995 [Bdellovibrio bacteriovorus]|uniref:Ferritin-like domain-containing protein n=1 Tax=Bdellovibrio bacteriovorus TaxID=959 RepID=A0A161PTE6_BDEBC|nr:hypothetical protein [Bdellovibrio bacteriovorus]KYG68598.1 hypothetical protein AZI87_04995 [Bdellovibrio bacteriovorus]